MERRNLSATDAIEILLVEDNPADAELTLHALQKSNLANKIQLVRDGEEALDFLFCPGSFAGRPFQQVPHLILLDLKLPKVDGLQVLEEVKRDLRTRAIPVIVLTTCKEERDMVSSYRLGVNSYIQKPVNFSEFQEVVRQLGMYWLLINSKPPASAYLAR
jgi:two-component system, response regulator